jgi:hypothetical protein
MNVPTEAMSFDPHSNDAMFAKVLAKLDEHGVVLKEIREAGQQTEREIETLKSWRDNFQGRITVIAALVSIASGILVSVVLRFLK